MEDGLEVFGDFAQNVLWEEEVVFVSLRLRSSKS